MKIVVFGPDRRVGALRGELVIDLSLAYAKLLKERAERAAAGLAGLGAGAKRSGDVHRGRRAHPGSRADRNRSSVRRHARSVRPEWRNAGAQSRRCASACTAAERLAHRLCRRQFRRPSRGHGGDGAAAGCRRDVNRAGRREDQGSRHLGLLEGGSRDVPARMPRCPIRAGPTGSTTRARSRSCSASMARMSPRGRSQGTGLGRDPAGRLEHPQPARNRRAR